VLGAARSVEKQRTGFSTSWCDCDFRSGSLSDHATKIVRSCGEPRPYHSYTTKRLVHHQMPTANGRRKIIGLALRAESACQTNSCRRGYYWGYRRRREKMGRCRIVREQASKKASVPTIMTPSLLDFGRKFQLNDCRHATGSVGSRPPARILRTLGIFPH
jgi:hypothetical protein